MSSQNFRFSPTGLSARAGSDIVELIPDHIVRNNSTRYPGGKNCDGTFQSIINLIPPHKVFIEGFAGSAPITRIKRPAELTWVIEKNPVVCARYVFPGDADIRVHCGDVFTLIEAVLLFYIGDPKDLFIYLDPPYPFSTRKSKRKIYKNELSDADHLKLCELLRFVPCSIAISSYRNAIYDKILHAWNRFDFVVQTRKGKAVESVYYNYPVPTELHDYSFAGRNFTRRQQLKRIGARLCSRLSAMPAVERNAIFEMVKNRFQL